VLVLPLVTLGLLSSHYPPLDLWPLGYVSLAPWLVAFCTTTRRVWSGLTTCLLGVAFFGLNIQWLIHVTPPGYVALILYLAVYFPAAGWLIRYAHVRRGLRLAVAVPVAWTAMEFIRGIGPLAFPWLLLGQSQYRILPMIQVADLGGVYAVTFVVAMVNGLLADFVVERRRRGDPLWPSRRVAVAVTAGLVIATVAYGQWRVGQDTVSPGPKVAVVQGDYPLSVDLALAATRKGPTWLDKRRAYFTEALAAAAAEPDMIVLPETPWPMTLNPEYREAFADRVRAWLQSPSARCDAWFRQLSAPDPDVSVITDPRKHLQRLSAAKTKVMDWVECFVGKDVSLAPQWREHLASGRRTTVVVGAFGAEFFPTAVYPKDKLYNSAYVYTPGRAEPQRYDKVHLVLFGEYVPFRGGRLHRVYLWLNSLTPWGRDGNEYSQTAGETFNTFSVEARTTTGDMRTYSFATPICYEDTIPYVCRAYAQPREPGGGKGADFFLNISNDGWFNHSAELTQHMAVSVFRAVENRVGIARAVNTGMSGFIDPTGRIRDMIPIAKQGHLVSNVIVDSRITLYTKWGDWFGIGCALLALLLLIDALFVYRRRHAATGQKDEET